MATIETEVEIDIDDYLDEADTDSLVDELESRGYDCYKKDTRHKRGGWVNFAMSYGYELRDHLLEITEQGHFVTDEELFDKLKKMIER